MRQAPTGERQDLMETRRDRPGKRVKQAVAERARMPPAQATASEAGTATDRATARGAGRERERGRATEPLRESPSREEVGDRMVQAPALCLVHRIMWQKCRCNPKVLTASQLSQPEIMGEDCQISASSETRQSSRFTSI